MPIDIFLSPFENFPITFSALPWDNNYYTSPLVDDAKCNNK